MAGMDTLQFPIVPLDFDEVAQILDNIVDNDFPEEMYPFKSLLCPRRVSAQPYHGKLHLRLLRFLSETIPEGFQRTGNYHFAWDSWPRAAASHGGPGRGEGPGNRR